MTHGTPVLSPVAIFAAHLTYGGPCSPKFPSTSPYSFSIWDSMIGPPCGAYNFSDCIIFTIFVVKFFM
uniref:Uncharacterized protein MANES_18G106800 n=1 Tax=Rhizophora mucronata TaxID=61149 RepID=A0A2P2IQ71_RHIMU